MLTRARRAADAIVAATLSPACAVCRMVLDHPTEGPVCAGCWTQVIGLAPPFCPRCGYPLASPLDATAAGCRRCATLDALDRLGAAGAYEGALREILHAFKYGRRRSLAHPLADLVATRCADVLCEVDALVPVPLHVGRRWARGFNQADLLAHAIGLPVWRALGRVRATSPQSGHSAGARRANLRGAFALAWPARRTRARLRGRVLALVDDVSTTGATLEACAAVLKAAGVAEVRAVVVARTLLELG